MDSDHERSCDFAECADGRFLYFAYGSNLHPIRLAKRTPSCRTVGVATLSAHLLCFHKRSFVTGDVSGKCSVQASPRASDIVHGVVYDIAESERASLDRAEGAGFGYETVELDVELKGRICRVSSYLAHPDWVDDSLRPYDWYLALVVAGARIHGLPVPWIERLQRVQDWCDPDRKRAADWLTVARARPGSRDAARPE